MQKIPPAPGCIVCTCGVMQAGVYCDVTLRDLHCWYTRVPDTKYIMFCLQHIIADAHRAIFPAQNQVTSMLLCSSCLQCCCAPPDCNQPEWGITPNWTYKSGQRRKREKLQQKKTKLQKKLMVHGTTRTTKTRYRWQKRATLRNHEQASFILQQRQAHSPI